MGARIEIRGLKKSFDGTSALRGVDATVPAGSVYGLVGPNGAGKTTLLGHISGALRQDAGTVMLDGQPTWDNPQATSRIASVPTDPWLPAGTSADGLAQVRDWLMPGFRVERYAELSRSFDFDMTKPIRALSHGQRRQVSLLLALAQTPDLLLLDEPMEGLDPLVRHRVWGLVMDQVAERGMTVVVATHNLRELDGICDHLGIMAAGSMRHEYDLAGVEGQLTKVQVLLPKGQPLPEELSIEKDLTSQARSQKGNLRMLVVRGDPDQVRELLASAHPLYLDLAPVSLEELFLDEFGGGTDEHHDNH